MFKKPQATTDITIATNPLTNTIFQNAAFRAKPVGSGTEIIDILRQLNSYQYDSYHRPQLQFVKI